MMFICPFFNTTFSIPSFLAIRRRRTIRISSFPSFGILKILEEAVDELKSDEFADLYADSDNGKRDSGSEYIRETHIESDLELMFPPTYIPNDSERVSLYRELDNMEEERFSISSSSMQAASTVLTFFITILRLPFWSRRLHSRGCFCIKASNLSKASL